MELSPEEILANFHFKRPDLTDFSLQQVERVICIYNSFMNGEARMNFKGLLHDLAYLQMNEKFFEIANLHFDKFLEIATGGYFVNYCYINYEIAKFVAERFKIRDYFLLMGSLKLPPSENGFIQKLINQVEDLDMTPPGFLYECLDHEFYYQLELVSKKCKRTSYSYVNLRDHLHEQIPKYILKLVILQYADLAHDDFLETFLSLGKFSLGKFYVEVSKELKNPKYQPDVLISHRSLEMKEVTMAFGIDNFDRFAPDDKVIFLYNLEIAKTCICLKALPPVLIQLILEFARPLASVIIPYLAKVYHSNKPMQTRSKRVKRELKSLKN